MNIKIKLAYFAIVLSILSFAGVLFGADAWAFIFFSIGCLIYSYLALYLYKNYGVENSSRAFFGGFIAMLIVLTIHVFFLAVTLIFRDSDTWRWGWQFLPTLFGIIPAVGVGIVVGGVADLFIRFRYGKTDTSVASQNKREIFKSIGSWAFKGLIVGLVLAIFTSAYWYVYSLNFAIESQGHGLDAKDSPFIENLISYLIHYSLLFVPIGGFVGFIVGIWKDKKAIN